ncbi:hypothetical protein NKR23_g11791 [Pleurostoma richardsiae]|uniref:Uncharacterized protein n=1 Tax=Pleurostoma richardsiae TaxID=41990 RepID=A0AA38VB83_9PEZI|nr:hypothetical protein NKR23_g11791 [Pleurostoma richardsiae]
MGVASSRALADHLASACAAADSGSFKAAQLMDANFLATLTGFLADVTADEGWAELPVELTTVISTYLERRRDVTQAVVARWIDEPWTFFSLPQGDPPTQLYLSLRALSRRNLDPVDEARRRVNLVLFHNLRTEFQERFGNPRKDPLTIYLSGVAKLTDPGEVKNNCSDWSYSGGRYIALGESSGGNGGLLLRTTIPRSRLEMRMPLAMDDRMIPTYAAQIRDKAERWRCHGAADKIIEYYTSIWKGWLADLSWEPSQESLRWGSKNAPGRVRKRQKRASAPGYKGPAYGMMTPGSDVQGLGGEVSWPNRSAAYNGPLALPTGLTSSGAVTAGSREPWNGGETQSRPPLLRDAAPLVAYNSATASKLHTTEGGRATLVAPTGDVRGRWAPDEGTAPPMQSTEVHGIAIQTIIDYQNPASNPDKREHCRGAQAVRAGSLRRKRSRLRQDACSRVLSDVCFDS